MKELLHGIIILADLNLNARGLTRIIEGVADEKRAKALNTK